MHSEIRQPQSYLLWVYLHKCERTKLKVGDWAVAVGGVGGGGGDVATEGQEGGCSRGRLPGPRLSRAHTSPHAIKRHRTKFNTQVGAWEATGTERTRRFIRQHYVTTGITGRCQGKATRASLHCLSRLHVNPQLVYNLKITQEFIRLVAVLQ